MPLIRNVSGEDRHVPLLGRVVFDEQTVEVPAEWVTNYTQQEPLWAPADSDATALHEAMLEGISEYLAATNPAAELVEETSAAELIEAIPSMDVDEVSALVEAEKARPKSRKTVLKAAESRLAEVNTNDSQEG